MSEKKTRKKKLSDNEINAVIELLKDHSNTMKYIASVTGVSQTSISRIKAKYINGKKSDNTNIECKNESLRKSDELKPINVISAVRVGLVAERHPMPVNDFIFKNRISNNLMFDYAKLERLCREYIEDTIKFDENGVSQQTLVVYVSGIQCVLSSLIKVTNEMKVNLILRHYNSDTNTYYRHVIWNQFGPTEIPEEINELFTNSTNSYVYNCTMDELYNNKYLIKISKVYYKDDAYKNIDHIDTILTKSIDDAFVLMKKHISEANKEKQKKRTVRTKRFNALRNY